MDVNEQRLYQLIQNVIQAGDNLKEIEENIKANKSCWSQTDLLENETRRITWTNLLYDSCQEMEDHKKYKNYLKSGVCFYCGNAYRFLRNHYANPKVQCSAKYSEDHPDTPNKKFSPKQEEENDDSDRECSNQTELNEISAQLATLAVENEKVDGEDDDLTCENLIYCSTQESSQQSSQEIVSSQESIQIVKNCEHHFDCGCNKSVCEECLEKEKNESESNDGIDCCDENCNRYYKYRNDNCNCFDRGCGYCAWNEASYYKR